MNTPNQELIDEAEATAPKERKERVTAERWAEAEGFDPADLSKLNRYERAQIPALAADVMKREAVASKLASAEERVRVLRLKLGEYDVAVSTLDAIRSKMKQS